MEGLWQAIDWGSVPGYFGALSVILALWIILRDRWSRDREQVDHIAVWPTIAYERQMPVLQQGETRIEEGQFDTFIHNTSHLPVRVIQIAWTVETRWMRPVGELVFEPVPGTDVRRSFSGDPFWLPPSDEPLAGSTTVNVAHLAPDGAVTLDLINGITARPDWVLVVDNGGRAWELRPGKKSRPRRVRWYTRPREYQPVRLRFGRIRVVKIE